MDINNLTIREVKEIARMVSVTGDITSPYQIGGKYLIRTVTMIYSGKVTAVGEKEIQITDAAWIPETDRWADTVAKGIFKEVEPYPDGAVVIIGRGAILDAVLVEWDLPRQQK